MSNEYKYEQKEIYERIDKFVLDTLALVRIVPRSLVNTEILKQLVRSAMSIGANAREAQGSQTRKEFIRRFSISKREAKETQYWLMLLTKQNPKLKAKIDKLTKECDEITAIISTTISSTRKNS